MPTALPSMAPPSEEQQQQYLSKQDQLHIGNSIYASDRLHNNYQDQRLHNGQHQGPATMAIKQESLDTDRLGLSFPKTYSSTDPPTENQPAPLQGLSNQYASQLQPEILSGMSDISGLTSKANLIFEGNVQEMALGWSDEEKQCRRRLVQFWRRHDNSTIHCTFRTIPPGTKPPNSIVISCIYWDEKNEFFITSVDCIHLLESLITVRFTVEEKNRIRRNLEGFRPLTVSKCKHDTAEFFKLIMAFPNPKPRNIEKDVKVFPWRVLPFALKKIVSKYATGFAPGFNGNPYGTNPSMKYDGASQFNPYGVGGGYSQAAGYQRRYSQPVNMMTPMGMYGQPQPQPAYFNYGVKQEQHLPTPSQSGGMAPIPERPSIEDMTRQLGPMPSSQHPFQRRHSVSDPYSVNRMHNRSQLPSLGKLEEDGGYPFQGDQYLSLYKNQPAGLGIAEGSSSGNNPTYRPN